MRQVISIPELSGLTGNASTGIQGLTPPARAFMTAGWFLKSQKSLLVVTADSSEAERLAGDVSFFLGTGGAVVYLPQWETLPYEQLSPHIEIVAARYSALYALANSDRPMICVTTANALIQKSPPKETLTGGFISLKVGDEPDRDQLAKFLTETGYLFTDPVEEPGTFAFRGGLLDIYPPQEDTPLRLEFFGDEVESIRRLDIDLQRSLNRVGEILIPPARETHYHKADIGRLCANLGLLEASNRAEIERLRAKFENREFFQAMELYMPLFYPDAVTPLEYMPEGAKIVFCEPEKIKERLEHFRAQIKEGYGDAVSRGDIFPPPDARYLNGGELERFFESHPSVSLTELSLEGEGGNYVSIMATEVDRLRGSFSRFAYDSKKRLNEEVTTLVVLGAQRAVKRMERLFAEEELSVSEVDQGGIARFIAGHFEEEEASAPAILLTVGDLTAGFYLEGRSLFVITEEEIFGRHKAEPRRKTRRRSEPFMTDFSELKEGDFVVHRDHGVGIYHGTKTVSVGDVRDEYIKLEYDEDQRLFLALSSIYLLEKYSGSGSPRPSLDKIGGRSWKKTQAKVKKNIMKMAKELLEIYARRETGKAYKFSREGQIHREFADAFEFSETEDQANAIADMSKDMESGKPMDRLICGDVGYGKTEVAMRAALKAAYDGRQTAILVPTTLLVNQHYETFTARMTESFAVRVEMLSRFVKKSKQKETLDGIKSGQVDVVIGTHRILQKDVEFRNLGLIIVDEEQRFGVAHKERLKKLRATVDVLTLSATPIPRTLHMAVSGIRDISIINTAPPGRLSIKTNVRKFSDGVIKEAIERETSRGGQVFFVHNRVQSIERMHDYLCKLVPQARIVVAHGQMNARELEKAMMLFVKRKIDVLLCTTIIESGLDIPNANTIIINRADKFGLAELYQLRGRVGRGRHRAYAYLLVPDALSVLARKRLKAIEELSALGSGFKLAARDMEIRGAGNMLGDQQSGNITAVGFDTYTRMLTEAVEELKHGKPKPKVETALSLEFIGKLEDNYIPVLEQRMNFYSRLYRSESFDEIKQVMEDLSDRYGPMPDTARKLVDAVTIRLAGSKLGIDKVELTKSDLYLGFAQSSDNVLKVTCLASETFPGMAEMKSNQTLKINLAEVPEEERTARVIRFLTESVSQGDD